MWGSVSQIGRQALTFAIMVFLARLLSPSDFGTVAMVTVITGFAHLFSDLGFGAALVQKQDALEEHLSTAFWINVVSGLALSALFWLGAPLIAHFYRDFDLTALTRLVSLTFVIKALGTVHRVRLVKRLDFRRLAVVEICSIGLAGAIAVLMAIYNFGVWSLAANIVLAAAFSSILLWLISSWRPKHIFSWSKGKELSGFGLNALGHDSLNYWVRNFDDLLIGSLFGATSLGNYSRAYSLMLFPLNNISRVVAQVMFPALSAIQKDTPRVKSVFLKMTRSIALITFPLMLGLFVVAESFVVAVFGQNWSAMIPILRVFSILGLAQSVGTVTGELFMSQGRADLQLRLGLVLKPVLLAGVLLGLRWEALGVAIGYSIASGIVLGPEMHFAGRLVKLSLCELLRALAGVFLCATVMAVAVFLLGAVLPPAWPHWALLGVQVPAGIVFYWSLVYLLRLEAYVDVWSLLADQLRRKPKEKVTKVL